MSEAVISVENLSKRYRIGTAEKRSETLFGKIRDNLRQPIRQFQQLRQLTSFSAEDSQDIIWALRNVTFEVKEGEIIGIVGRNGAGKTTLLRILSRITAPTNGSFEVIGDIGLLLEVGTGFHPELTGRENIYLNGSILGMRKNEVDRRFDEIVDFSGVEKYLDTPVKRYSSGMQMRLAFAVAAHLNADILLIDEVLAVGDIEFQKKCLGRMKEIGRQNRTVLFISHNIGAVRSLCSKGIYLVDGQIKQMGDIDSVCNNYIRDLQRKRNDYSKDGITVDVNLKDEKGDKFEDWRYLEWLIVEVEVESFQEFTSPAVDLSFYSNNGVLIAAFRSDMMTEDLLGKSLNTFKIVFRLQNPGLTTDEIYLNVGLRTTEDINRYGSTVYLAVIEYAAVIPISQINLSQYSKSNTNTICHFPVELKIES